MCAKHKENEACHKETGSPTTHYTGEGRASQPSCNWFGQPLLVPLLSQLLLQLSLPFCPLVGIHHACKPRLEDLGVSLYSLAAHALHHI